MAKIIPASPSYRWLSTDVDAKSLLDLTHVLMARGIKYGFGSKVRTLDVSPQKATFTKANSVDCSGFVRYALWQQGIKVPDGSWGQADWAKNTVGLKPCDLADVGNHDGRLRLGYLPPTKATDGIGHIFFVYNTKLIESHGSHGPDDQRTWGSKPWHQLCHVYVLNAVPVVG